MPACRACARLRAASRQARRGLVFGFWTAHETGTMVGSSWFADRNWDRVRKHAVAYMMIDQPGMLGTTRWSAHSTAGVAQVSTRTSKAACSRQPHRRVARAPKTGDSSFFGAGHADLLGRGRVHAGGAAGDCQRHLRLVASLARVDLRQDRLGLDGRSHPHLRSAIYGSFALPQFCRSSSSASPISSRRASASWRRLEARSEWTASPAHASARKLSRSGSMRPPSVWNDRYRADAATDNGSAGHRAQHLHQAAEPRLLLPIASTAKGTYGHDTFSFTPQSTVIPCLYDVPKLSRMSASGPERWHARNPARARAQPCQRCARRCPPFDRGDFGAAWLNSSAPRCILRVTNAGFAKRLAVPCLSALAVTRWSPIADDLVAEHFR